MNTEMCRNMISGSLIVWLLFNLFSNHHWKVGLLANPSRVEYSGKVRYSTQESFGILSRNSSVYYPGMVRYSIQEWFGILSRKGSWWNNIQWKWQWLKPSVKREFINKIRTTKLYSVFDGIGRVLTITKRYTPKRTN